MIERHGKSALLHSVVAYQGTIYLAGIVAKDKTAPMKIQTEQVLAIIDEHLAAHGSDKTRVLSATIFITDMALRAEMNEAWIAFFGDSLPARATVAVADLGQGVLIEVVVTAAAAQ